MKFTLQNVTGTFPSGTKVGAYRDALSDSGHPVPIGDPLAEATVAGDDTLTFDVPNDRSTYVAAAEIGGAWKILRFTTPGETPSGIPVSQEGVAGGVAMLGSDSTVGGPGGSALSPSVVTDSSGNGTADWKVVKEAPLNVEWAEYGADGTGASLADTAFEKALAALPAEGGEIFAPRHYKLSKQLNLDLKRSLTIRGVAARTSGATPASQIIFTQEGSSALISGRSAVGIHLLSLGIAPNAEGFTGTMIDFGSTGAGQNTYSTIERCQLFGYGGSAKNATGILANQTADLSIIDTSFFGCKVGIKGKTVDTDESINVRVIGGLFKNIQTIPILNPGQSWRLLGQTIENLESGNAGFVNCEEGIKAYGLVIDTPWCGDVTNSKGVWVTFRGESLFIIGGLFGNCEWVVDLPEAASDSIKVLTRMQSVANGIRANWSGGLGKDYLFNSNIGATGKSISLDNGTTDWGSGLLSPALNKIASNAQTASYTLAPSDAGKAVSIESAEAKTLTIPTNASVAFPVGTVIEVVRLGAGTLTVAGAEGVTLNSPGSKVTLASRYSTGVLRKTATNTWILSGDLA